MEGFEPTPVLRLKQLPLPRLGYMAKNVITRTFTRIQDDVSFSLIYLCPPLAAFLICSVTARYGTIKTTIVLNGS